jgi:hypothetical protein
MKMLIRASGLGNIMTKPKSKDETLSAGAKTYIKTLAKEFVYGYKEQITSKYMEKGTIVENESIALYNKVFGTNYVKNTERKSNEYVTGECDICTGYSIIDIKSSWSLATFPCFAEDGQNKDYMWQGVAYMMLWDVDEFEIAYCMVNTPDNLMKYEPQDMHLVDHIDESLRVTILPFKRDKSMEDELIERCTYAQKYYNEMIEQIATEHNFIKD